MNNRILLTLGQLCGKKKNYQLIINFAPEVLYDFGKIKCLWADTQTKYGIECISVKADELVSNLLEICKDEKYIRKILNERLHLFDGCYEINQCTIVNLLDVFAKCKNPTFFVIEDYIIEDTIFVDFPDSIF